MGIFVYLLMFVLIAIPPYILYRNYKRAKLNEIVREIVEESTLKKYSDI